MCQFLIYPGHFLLRCHVSLPLCCKFIPEIFRNATVIKSPVVSCRFISPVPDRHVPFLALCRIAHLRHAHVIAMLPQNAYWFVRSSSFHLLEISFGFLVWICSCFHPIHPSCRFIFCSPAWQPAYTISESIPPSPVLNGCRN
jgi:hypothetical protein